MNKLKEDLEKGLIHPADVNEKEYGVKLLQERTTNPRREMIGTEYLFEKDGNYLVVETIDDEFWDDGLWKSEYCVIEEKISYNIITK